MPLERCSPRPLAVADELEATVVNMRFVKPLDAELVLQMAARHDLLVTVEENVIQGGAGSAVSECLAEHGVLQAIIHHGLPDRLLQHGSRDDMLEDAGLTAAGLLHFIQQYFARTGQIRAAKMA